MQMNRGSKGSEMRGDLVQGLELIWIWMWCCAVEIFGGVACGCTEAIWTAEIKGRRNEEMTSWKMDG